MYIHTHANIHTYIHTHTCITFMYIHTHANIHTSIHTHTCTSMQVKDLESIHTHSLSHTHINACTTCRAENVKKKNLVPARVEVTSTMSVNGGGLLDVRRVQMRQRSVHF